MCHELKKIKPIKGTVEPYDLKDQPWRTETTTYQPIQPEQPTIRDHYAMHAMAALILLDKHTDTVTWLNKTALAYADNMMRQR